MNEETFYWQPFEKGFYIAWNTFENFIGIAFSIAYIPSEKCFQIMLHVWDSAIAIGWQL